jgi:cytochrome c biogenesis protein CcmG/thiol:disulfide interchange protein DsbE
MKTLALTVVLATTLFGCSSPSSVSNQDKDPNLRPILMKGPAPDFELENIEGGKLKAADLKGKVSVIDFWATWCEPCWSEIPKYNKMLDEFRGKDVQIIGITVESPYKDIKPKAKELGIKYTVLVGNDTVQDGFGGMIGYPTTFIVTKDWKIYKKYMGALADKDQRIRKDIEALLAKDQPEKATD